MKMEVKITLDSLKAAIDCYNQGKREAKAENEKEMLKRVMAKLKEGEKVE